MLDDAADVVEGGVTQAGIAVACKQVLAVFPNRLVHVHAAAVVAHQGFGHEGGGFAEVVRHVVDHVFHVLGLVGTVYQGAEFGADFHLAAGADFAVVHFHFNADFLQDVDHGGAQILPGIHRRHGGVAAFHHRAVAGVLAVQMQAARPGGAFGGDFETGFVHMGFKLNAVEHEKFGLGAEIGRVAHAAGFQIGFGSAGDGARVAVVALAAGRVDHVAGEHQGGIVVEGVDEGGGRIGAQLHIGGLDALPAADRRAVESLAVFKPFFRVVQHHGGGHGEMVLFAFGVGESQINETDIVFFNHANYIADGHGGTP